MITPLIQRTQWILAVTTPSGLVCSCRAMLGEPFQVVDQLRIMAPDKRSALSLVDSTGNDPPLQVSNLSEMMELMNAAEIPALLIAVYRNRTGWHWYNLNGNN